MFSGRKGIGYIGTILSKKKEYFDDDVLETNLGVEKIGRKKCIGYEVRLVERVLYNMLIRFSHRYTIDNAIHL